MIFATYIHGIKSYPAEGKFLDTHTMINTLLALVAFLGGWMIRTMWQSIRDLKTSCSDTADKVQKIEVLVAGDYVKKDDLDRKIDAIFAKLDKIHDKLDTKADKVA